MKEPRWQGERLKERGLADEIFDLWLQLMVLALDCVYFIREA